MGKLESRALRWVGYVLVIMMILAVPSVSFGLGLEVGPDEIYVENVPMGEITAVSALGGERMKLSIKNKSASAYTYTIDILPVAKTTAPLKEGYLDIADTSWIWPENKEVRVEGNSVKAVELYLNIPQKEEYYGRNYQAVIEVKSKKNKSDEIFVLACQLRMYVGVGGQGIEDSNQLSAVSNQLKK